jgi:hypothetical protein
MNDIKENILLVGEFAVFPQSKIPKKFLISNVQTCIGVVLIVPGKGVCGAHIDNGFNAAQAIEDMIAKLKSTLGELLPNIKAILVGGDYYDIVGFSSAAISKPIYATLQRHKIPYIHEHFTGHAKAYLPSVFYSAAWALGLIGPESKLYFGLLLSGITIAAAFIEPGFFSKNFQIIIDLQTLDIKVRIISNHEELDQYKKIDEQKHSQQRHHDFFRCRERINLDMKAESNKEKLKIHDVTSSFK